MRCAYCFYADVSGRRSLPSCGIMDTGVRRAILENITRNLEDGDELTIVFQGGEPALAGLPWYEDFVQTFAAVRRQAGRHDTAVKFALQTNGLLLDRAWGEFLKQHSFLVGLSLDGPGHFHNRSRVDSGGQGTYDRVVQGKKLLEEYGVEYNILTVLTNEMAGYPEKICRFMEEQQIRYIQFIPCLEDLDTGSASKTALRPAGFANFYAVLLRWWIRNLEQGLYVSVKFFEDVINLFFKGIPTACGIDGNCRAQFVVEADGGVYPCDFYALDQYCAGNLARQTFREIADTDTMRFFARPPENLPPPCRACAYREICRGGCKRMRRTVYCGSGVCGFKTFLDRCLPVLSHTFSRFFSPRTG
jgi:uncharacterized protein